MTMTMTFTCTWGERLSLEVSGAPGGLKAVVAEIDQRVGGIATRNTYAKLFDLDGPPETAKELLRAALMLAALGQNVETWGIDLDQIPPIYRDVVDQQKPSCQEIRAIAA